MLLRLAGAGVEFWNGIQMQAGTQKRTIALVKQRLRVAAVRCCWIDRRVEKLLRNFFRLQLYAFYSRTL